MAAGFRIRGIGQCPEDPDEAMERKSIPSNPDQDEVQRFFACDNECDYLASTETRLVPDDEDEVVVVEPAPKPPRRHRRIVTFHLPN